MTDSAKAVVIVTGGGRGIGAAISRAFLDDGARVVVAQRQVPELPELAGVEFIRSDLTNTDECEALIEQTITRFGRLDTLVNNAGVMFEELLENLTLESFDKTMAINLRAPFILSRCAIPHLKKTAGSIINIGSIEGNASNLGHAAYCASKAGLQALTRATAVDHGNAIRCNAVAPGWIDTELNEAFVQGQCDPQTCRKRLASIHPSGKIGKPEDVASVVTFLASAGAAFVNGETIVVDGGRTIKLPLP